MAPRLKRRTSGNSKPYGTLIPATAVTAALLTAITVGIAVGSWAGGLALESALDLRARRVIYGSCGQLGIRFSPSSARSARAITAVVLQGC
ncbi:MULTISPECIES: hypothetical protein [Streptomyces]|uniref:hypothetical protein n=1 Tax=Streptomyces TaxID=1883 RepID=UPI000CF2DEAD|nr:MULTISPECIES: hypothetical protein [Streptomyces]PPS70174.1 hypothetical protein BV882_25640 [Streptomyces sp. 46]